MERDYYDVYKLKSAVEDGSLPNLKFACEFAERVVNIVESNGEVYTMRNGSKAYRARKDYIERIDEATGMLNLLPVGPDEIAAPPLERTSLGRFNRPQKPVLYLSTTPEVALAECKSLSTDTCTIGVFETTQECRLAQFLRHDHLSFPLGEDDADIAAQEEYLLYTLANFLSRRVEGSEREPHYRACNLIASAFEAKGYDGIIYRTSFWSSRWRTKGQTVTQDNAKSANVALFSPSAAEPIYASLHNINWMRPMAEQAGNSYWEA